MLNQHWLDWQTLLGSMYVYTRTLNRRECLIVIAVMIMFTYALHMLTFTFQEIDGKALLLLTSDMMMRYMGLKLGPALKLCHVIEKLKHRKWFVHDRRISLSQWYLQLFTMYTVYSCMLPDDFHVSVVLCPINIVHWHAQIAFKQVYNTILCIICGFLQILKRLFCQFMLKIV